MGVMRFMESRIKLTEKDKEFLLNLARSSIKYFLENEKIIDFDKNKLQSKKFEEKHATFVTLTENNNLRGCIGNLEPINPLYLDVIKNAVYAAFYDSRFPKLESDELNKIKIEISILTNPVKISYSSPEDLLRKIKINKDGIILKYKNHQATFLPQVWEQLPRKEQFLSHLCMKALLPHDFWKTCKAEIYKYNVISFEENKD